MRFSRTFRSCIALPLVASLALGACEAPDSVAPPDEPLAAEAGAIGGAQPPKPESTEYVQINTTRSDVSEAGIEWNNFVYKDGLRTVTITGKTLVIDEADANGILQRTDNDPNIKAVELNAETLIVRTTVAWPMASLTIRAEKIIFEDTGSEPAMFDLTPIARNIAAPDTPGKNGNKAGALNVFAKSVVAPGNKKRFKVVGGKAEDGAPGKHGKAGADGERATNAHINYAKLWGICGPLAWKLVKVGPHNVAYWNVGAGLPITKEQFAEGAIKVGGKLPQKGENGKPGTLPGAGGAGGKLTTNLAAVETMTARYGGVSGAGAGIFQGGPPGKPTTAYTMTDVNYITLKCPTTGIVGENPPPGGGQYAQNVITCDFPAGNHNQGTPKLELVGVQTHTIPFGDDVLSPINPVMQGATGGFTLRTSQFDYFNPLTLSVNIAFAEDAYINDFDDLARTELEKNLLVVDALQASAEWAKRDKNEQRLFNQQETRMRQLVAQLDAKEDFFGNPEGWAPALSLEANKLLFANEVEWAIRTIFVADWLTSKNATAGNRAKMLAETKKLLNEEIARLKTTIQNAMVALPQLEQKLNEHIAAVAALELELKAAEKRLMQKVMDAHKVPLWKKALGVVAVLAKAFPNPYVQAAGSTLDVLLGFTDGFDMEDLAAIGDVAKEWKGVIDKADDAKAKTDENDPAKAKDKAAAMDTMDKLGKYVEDVSAALKKQFEAYEKMEAPKGDVEKKLAEELAKLKELDPEFQKLAAALKKVTEARETVNTELVKTLKGVEDALVGISRNYLQIAELAPEIEGQLDIQLSARAQAGLEDMRHLALLRLRKYQYLLARAFEYRMLQPYPGDLTLSKTFEKMVALVNGNTNGVPPDALAYEPLFNAFREDLSKITSIVVDDSQAGPINSSSFTYTLNAEELARFNAGEPLDFDFWEKGAFFANQQDVRIADVNVRPDIQVAASGTGPLSRLRISVEHEGISRQWSRGQMHIHRHYNDVTETPITWSASWQNGTLTDEGTSDAATSLIKSLLPPGSPDILLFARPGAWSNLRLSKEVLNEGTFEVKGLTIEVAYDFRLLGTGTWIARRDGQNATINGIYAEVVGRAPTFVERRAAREALDLGTSVEDLKANVEFALTTEHFQFVAAGVVQTQMGRAAGEPERVFWGLELERGRDLAQVNGYLALLKTKYGTTVPTFEQLTADVAAFDAGAP